MQYNAVQITTKIIISRLTTLITTALEDKFVCVFSLSLSQISDVVENSNYAKITNYLNRKVIGYIESN